MRTFLRIMFIVVVAALIIGMGLAVFNAGLAQGAAQSGVGSGKQSEGIPAPYYPIYRPLGLWGFGCFAIFGLFLLFPLLFGFGRMLFGPRRDWHRGPWSWRDGRHFNGDQVPPFVEEMHRKMHEKMNQPPTPQA